MWVSSTSSRRSCADYPLILPFMSIFRSHQCDSFLRSREHSLVWEITLMWFLHSCPLSAGKEMWLLKWRCPSPRITWSGEEHWCVFTEHWCVSKKKGRKPKNRRATAKKTKNRWRSISFGATLGEERKCTVILKRIEYHVHSNWYPNFWIDNSWGAWSHESSGSTFIESF